MSADEAVAAAVENYLDRQAHSQGHPSNEASMKFEFSNQSRFVDFCLSEKLLHWKFPSETIPVTAKMRLQKQRGFSRSDYCRCNAGVAKESKSLCSLETLISDILPLFQQSMLEEANYILLPSGKSSSGPEVALMLGAAFWAEVPWRASGATAATFSSSAFGTLAGLASSSSTAFSTSVALLDAAFDATTSADFASVGGGTSSLSATAFVSLPSAHNLSVAYLWAPLPWAIPQ